MIKLRLQTLTEVTGSVCESPNQNPDLPIYPYPDSEPPFNADSMSSLPLSSLTYILFCCFKLGVSFLITVFCIFHH